MELINLNDICKTYTKSKQPVNVLKKISLAVNSGDFLGIVGASGSGKTTLLNIIGFLDSQSSGDYIFLNKPTNKLTKKQLAKLRTENIGFIFQNFNLINSLTALENVTLPLYYKGINKRKREAMGISALKSVGLEEKCNFYPSELSGGQCQRVAVARAVVTKPKLILADEPTGNLDSFSGETIKKLLFELNRKGHTIILITHDKEFSSLLPKTATLKDGVIKVNS